MFNTLLFIHLVVSILLIIIILLQKTSTDGLSGIGGGGNNMGLVSGRTAANFMTKTTIFLAVIFFVNALVLANISNNSQSNIVKKLENKATTTKSKNAEFDSQPSDSEAAVILNSDDLTKDDHSEEIEDDAEQTRIQMGE